MSKIVGQILDRLQALAIENHDLKTRVGGGVMASEIEPYDPAGLREALAKMGPGAVMPAEDPSVIARLQSELAELGTFCDECQERSNADRDELEKACAEIEALKVERNALIASVDAHLDELNALKDRLALQEAAAGSVSDEARMAQDHAAWMASSQALRQVSKSKSEATPIESSKSEVTPPTLPTEEPEPAYVMPPAPAQPSEPQRGRPSGGPFDDEIRRCFIAGKTWKQTAQAVQAVGGKLTEKGCQQRAYLMGLRAKDREQQLPIGRSTERPQVRSEAHERVIEKAKALPAIVVPETLKPGLSRIAQTYGERLLAMASDGYSPDDIAAELNIGAGVNDKVNAALVRKALVELRAAQRGAA